MGDRDGKTQELLKQGMELLHARGYNATGVQNIVNAAGVPKGSFYSYFSSKEQFAVEVIHYYSSLTLNGLGVLEDSALSPVNRIKKLFMDLMEFTKACSLKQGCLVGNLCQEMADHNRQIAVASEQMFQNFQERIAKCLKEAQTQGEIGADRDADALAGFILNSWSGTQLRIKAARDERLLDEFMDVLEKVILV